MSNTTNLDLERPDKGDAEWHTSLNSNMTKLDAGYGNNVASIADLPEVYIETGTFNHDVGDVITLPKSVDAINEYNITITPTTGGGTDPELIWVEKGTANFVVKCNGNNTTDTFDATIYYIGDIASYGGSIYRRWYVSPDATITDHGDDTDVGSFAWVLDQIGASPATVELPGNKTYTITTAIVVPDNVNIIPQKGAVFDLVGDLTINGSLEAQSVQIFLNSGGDAIFTNGSVKQLNAKWWGAVGDDSNNDTTSIHAWLDAIFVSNISGFLPSGIYLVDTIKDLTGVKASHYGETFTIIGEPPDVGENIDGDRMGSYLKWGGSDSSANYILKLIGIRRGRMINIGFDGDNRAGVNLNVNYIGGAGQWASDGWEFENCEFSRVIGGNHEEVITLGGWDNDADTASFYMSGDTNCQRFVFRSCRFQHGYDAFRIDNANALDFTFKGCNFDRAYNSGMRVEGGGWSMYGCEFSLNYTADLDLSAHSSLVMVNCWSEQSNRFVWADSRTQASGLTLIGCRVHSYPWAFWKQGYRSQPTNDDDQWTSIYWDRTGILSLESTIFEDPYSFVDQGGAAPTVSSKPLIWIKNSKTPDIQIFNSGSLSMTSASTYTNDFLGYGWDGTNIKKAGFRKPQRSGYRDIGGIAGNVDFDLYIFAAGFLEFTVDANVTFTSMHPLEAGDRVRLLINQAAGGAQTMTFPANVKLVGGAYTLTAGAAAVDLLEFESDGTNWWEISRGQDLS